MDHIIAAIENALTSGRWRDAAPLLSDILSNGMTCELKSLEHYERLAGQKCDDDKVRFHLTSRLRMVDDRNWASRAAVVRQAERLAEVVREHGYPCRVVGEGRYLRVASRAMSDTRRWTWVVEEIEADKGSVWAWMGY